MKKYLYLFLVVFIYSCGEENEKVVDINDNSTIDTIPEKEIIVEEIDTTNKNLIRLLEHPIDLIEYKEIYGNSHSGSGNFSEIFDTPDTVGFLYSYFFFYKLKHELKGGYSTSELFDGLRFYVYKYGDEVGRFSDTNEVLMAIESHMDNPTLGDLNFVGKNENELFEVLGNPHIQTESNLIYEFEQKVFSIHIKEGTCDWFKFAKINNTVNLKNEVPDFFKVYK